MPDDLFTGLGQKLKPLQQGSVEWWNQRAANHPGNKILQDEAAVQAQLTAAAGGPKIGDIWTAGAAGRETLSAGANFTPIGSTYLGGGGQYGGGLWMAPNSGPPKTVTPPPATITPPGNTTTNLGAYTPPTDKFTNPTPSPSPLNYLGLPNYANMGSNFSGGTNSSNPFAGLFGNPDQTNFLSGWT